MKILTVILTIVLDIIPSGEAFLNQLQKRDSVLIGDQLEYGFTLDSLKTGMEIGLMDFSEASNDTLTLVRNWKIDTLSLKKKTGLADVKASIIVAPFEEGTYHLPDLYVALKEGKRIDTLLFSACDVEVKTMPVDTATFEIHDIKPQKRYPLTVQELAPYMLGFQLLAALVILVVCLVKIRKRRETGEPKHRDPAYIVALRALDRYRGDKHWQPEKQKAFYSGVTDALKVYMEDRFGIDAPEMTTAELFAALKSDKDLTPELYGEAKELFERADFVKFAKYVASDEDNAKVLPTAVRFVTSTYQTVLEEEQKENVL